MKHFILSAAILAFTLVSLSAQEYKGQFTVTVVEASAVPTGIAQSQEANFPGIAVRQWKKQEYSNKRLNSVQYLAVFTQNGQNTRARYQADGRSISSYATYRPEALPTPIQTTLATDYPDHILTGAAEITSLQQGWSGFRIRLREGNQKLVVWLTAEGSPISLQQVPSEVSAEEAE
ncbi:MAG: hypothetical protein AAFZ63_03650 [Bacteroidota bacterium]